LEVTIIRSLHYKRIFALLQITVLAFGLTVGIKMAMAFSENSSGIVNTGAPISDNPGLSAENGTDINSGLIALAAGLAIAVTGIGAALGLGTAASAAAAAITERPESFGKLLVLLALIEAIAIYGFVIAFVLSGKI
jgi:V/A-type H+-transporting ATPase subunit K